MNRAEPSGRDDAFISYAREDLAFTRRLHDALVARGKRVWVDLEDIPPTVDWRAEMHAGIEESKAFVFVLSPESISSRVCMEELDNALVLRKRLVPILYRYVASTQLRAELKAPNWISFGDAAGFDKSVDLLVEALDADYEWLDAHARYAVLAGDWERSGRDGSLLLRGSDLRQAETWLAESAAHTETASDIQIEFILASRRAAARRRQKLFAATLLALVVSIGLGVFAFIQRSEAISKQDLARSRELAARSVAQLSTDPELAILVAREALAVETTDQAEQALREAILASRVRLRLPQPKTTVVDAMFRPPADDRVLTLGEDGKVRLWDAASGKLRRVVPADQVDRASFSPEGRLVATATRPRVQVGFQGNGGRKTAGEGEPASPTFRFWHAGSLEPTAARVRADSVWFLPDGRRLLAVRGKRVFLTDAYDGRTIWTLEPGGKEIAEAGLSGDGRYAVVARVDGIVRVWDVAKRRLVRTIRTRLNVASARLSPDGSRLVVTSFAEGQRPGVPGLPPLFLSSVAPRDLPPTLPHDLPVYLPNAFLWRLPAGPMQSFPANFPAYALFSPDGSRLVTVGSSFDLWGVRPGPGPPRRLFHLSLTGDASPAVEFAFTSRYLLVDETVRDATTGAVIIGGSAGSTAHFSSNGQRLALVPPGRHVTMILDPGGRDISTLPFRQVVGLAGDGRRVATAQDGGLQIWSTVDPRRPPARATVPSGVAQVSFGGGGDVAFVDNAGASWIWSTQVRGGPRPLSRRRVDELVFGGGGRVLAATESPEGTLPGRVEVWRIRRPARGASQADRPKVVDSGSDHSQAAVSDDGRYLATWSTPARRKGNGTIRIRDLELDDEVVSLRPSVPFGSDLAFTPDASSLGIVAADGTLTIWDWRRNTTRRVVSSHGAAGAAAFSPDGRFVSLAIASVPVGRFEESSPGGIDVFDAKTGEEVLFRPAPGLETVRQAEFTSRDDAVAAVTSASSSGARAAVRTFSCEVCLPLRDLEKLGVERTTRQLRCDEREQFLDQRCKPSP